MARSAVAAPALSALDWDGLDDGKFAAESERVKGLNKAAGLSREARSRVSAAAIDLVERARTSSRQTGLMESFLQEFGLSNKEGLALMCLAEALLRVPDAKTADALIAEKIGSGAWGEHAWKSENWLVNASTLGLMLSGSLMEVDPAARKDPGDYFRSVAGRVGEPVIRAATRQAMRILGEQFVLGRNIKAAIRRGHGWKVPAGHYPLFSFDMLGEGARTARDAARYHQRYLDAIAAVSAARRDGPVEAVDGVSVKLSALHPRYNVLKSDRLWTELYPKVLEQAEAAKAANIGFCLDAEESDRLVISLMVLEQLAHEPSLAGWNGLGLALQAYQKRAQGVIAKLAELGRASGRRLMVRLVKGAYWDTEIKFAQMNGWPDFPVWSTKAATDLNYLACARALLSEPASIYPQFATHNAHSLCAVREIAAELGNDAYEFQRLHGMGEPLYNAAADAFDLRPVRVYAPVGSHEDLLPYLVRRLLENGANTSFVHSFLDPDVPAADVARGPFEGADSLDRHPFIAAPPHIYGPHRMNAKGTDLTQARVRAELASAQATFDKAMPHVCGPLIAGKEKTGSARELASPAHLSVIVSKVSEADQAMVNTAFETAHKAFEGWDGKGGPARAAILRQMADALEDETPRFMAILTREAGKTLGDGVAEVREAVDFLRYYAAEAETKFGHADRLPGPAGETNHLELAGKGVFACISPWNFPLAIFTGQLAAALAAGNTVVAKPAEQTPLVACEAVKLFFRAGLPKEVLQLVPGDGKVGAMMTSDPLLAGVAFTGSTEVARIINRTLAERDSPILPLIAETGGLNAMFVDTSALKEQVIDDVIVSAFGSAGQRCSALRILFVPNETADSLIEGLKGAMDALDIGDAANPASDVGPVIDEDALAMLKAHETRMEAEATILHRAPIAPDVAGKGHFFAPLLVELKSIDTMEREVFGPILHVVRYKRSELPKLARALAAKGYGLTLGVHSRLQRFLDSVREAVPAGNTYVNRNMTGAVVGVQPFGGEGLSGTGPKAGGPHYLYRFATERVITVNISAQGGDPELLNLG